MSDRLQEIANRIDELLEEYESIVLKDLNEKNDLNNKIFAISAIYIPKEKTFIKLIR